MKLMFASDIHGSESDCRQMTEIFEQENAERLILLGDLLYHGPRNDLPECYAPKEVIKMLNAKKDKLFCVRGNCEAEVDQMVLEFPVMAEYALMLWGGRTIFITHGHIFNNDNPPLIKENDILIHGHTHVQTIENHGYIYINPGSVSLPKNNCEKSFMLFEDGIFTIYTLYGRKKQFSYKII